MFTPEDIELIPKNCMSLQFIVRTSEFCFVPWANVY